VVVTAKGNVTVAWKGDRTKPAMLTYHDLGLNYISNFQVQNFRGPRGTIPGWPAWANCRPMGDCLPTLGSYLKTNCMYLCTNNCIYSVSHIFWLPYYMDKFTIKYCQKWVGLYFGWSFHELIWSSWTIQRMKNQSPVLFTHAFCISLWSPQGCFFKLPPYTLTWFDFTTHKLPSGDETPRPRRRARVVLKQILKCGSS
jgi:hypothetical protein